MYHMVLDHLIWKNFLSQICLRTIFEMNTASRSMFARCSWSSMLSSDLKDSRLVFKYYCNSLIENKQNNHSSNLGVKILRIRVTLCPPHKLIGCHGINSMTLIRVNDLNNVSLLSWIGTPDAQFFIVTRRGITASSFGRQFIESIVWYGMII